MTPAAYLFYSSAMLAALPLLVLDGLMFRYPKELCSSSHSSFGWQDADIRQNFDGGNYYPRSRVV